MNCFKKVFFKQKKDNLKPFDLLPKQKIKVIEFLEKETKYKTTKDSFKEIKTKGKWNKDDIEKRTEELALETYNLFSKLQ